MKMRATLLLLALALLLSGTLCACRKDPEDPAPADPDGGVFDPAGDGEDTENAEGDGGKADLFFEQNRYPYDYQLIFSDGENEIDTARGLLCAAGVFYQYDFRAHLAGLYYDASEKNFFALPEDLTLLALTGTATAEGTQVITVAITASGETHTVRTDAEAFLLDGNADISNLRSLIRELRGLIPAWAAQAAPVG